MGVSGHCLKLTVLAVSHREPVVWMHGAGGGSYRRCVSEQVVQGAAQSKEPHPLPHAHLRF